MSAKPPFESVVATYGVTVLRVCRAVLDVADADDAWAETFVAALRAYPELPAGANVEAWLVKIAQRKAIDAIRAARRRPLPADTLPESVSPGPAGRDHSEPGHFDADLLTAVRALPPKQRQAVGYHYLIGLPYAEVAEVLGGSADAARRAAADGIAALRRGGAFPHADSAPVSQNPKSQNPKGQTPKGQTPKSQAPKGQTRKDLTPTVQKGRR